jgi:RNA polymerase primary sigma factor
VEINCRYESGVEYTKMQLAAWLRPLSERERLVIVHRFGWMDGVAHTLQETGDINGMTREQVRRIEIRACRKMRYTSS